MYPCNINHNVATTKDLERDSMHGCPMLKIMSGRLHRVMRRLPKHSCLRQTDRFANVNRLLPCDNMTNSSSRCQSNHVALRSIRGNASYRPDPEPSIRRRHVISRLFLLWRKPEFFHARTFLANRLAPAICLPMAYTSPHILPLDMKSQHFRLSKEGSFSATYLNHYQIPGTRARDCIEAFFWSAIQSQSTIG